MAAAPEKPAASFPYDTLFAEREAHDGRRKDPPPRGRIALLASLALVVMLGASTAGLFAVSRHQGSPIVKGSISTPGTLSTSLPPTITLDAPLPGAANWSMYGFDAHHSQFNPYEKTISVRNVPHLAPAWVMHINGGIDFAPAIVNGVLYITGGGPTLYAIDTRTETVIWKTSLQPFGYASYIYSPTVVNGILYLASDFDALAAFDARTGKHLWSFSINGTRSSPDEDSPTFANGIIYFGSHGGNVYALNARTGRVIWGTLTGGYTGVAVANGVVYAASNTRLYALSASTGHVLWTGPIGTKKTVEVAPVVGSGMVVVATDDAVVLAFSATGCGQSSCAPRWEYDTQQKVWASPAMAYGVIYLATLFRDFNGGNLYALDARTGQFLWLAQTDSLYAAPVVANGVVYAINFYGYAYAFDARGCGTSACSPLWRHDYFDINSGIGYSITIVNGQVYICTAHGFIYALRAS